MDEIPYSPELLSPDFRCAHADRRYIFIIDIDIYRYINN